MTFKVFIRFTDNFTDISMLLISYNYKEALKNQGKRDKNIAREVKQDMSITKARQMILHLYEKSGEKPIFEHVDCSKLPQNPESAPQSTSVAGGNLLAAMFGTADDEEEELQGDSRYLQ